LPEYVTFTGKDTTVRWGKRI